MAKAVKLADIAEKLNVSTVTVSKALSDQKGVSEEMRAKIKKLADELGYKQPSASRREKVQKGYNIGILISQSYLDKYDTFYWQMYQMVVAKTASSGCFALLEVISVEDEAQRSVPKLITEQKVDGIIIIGPLAKEYLAHLEKEAKIPFAYLDYCDEKQDCDAVISDSYYGAYALTNYLFEMGHEKIAYVGTILATGSITDRYLGYLKSMLEHRKDVPQEWVIPDRHMDDGRIDRENLIKLPKDNMPTAFVCNCDLTASEVIKKLQANGYRVPEDISVVGYDNYLYPGLCDIEITTYEVDMWEMAAKTVEIILNKMEKKVIRHGITIVEGKLVYKDSVRKLKK